MKTRSLLPNICTTGNFFLGIYAILSAMHGNFERASWLIMGGMLLDFFDGQLARRHKCATSFGFHYDSLTDLVTFGIAPAMIVYQYVLAGHERYGLAVVFIYAVCCAMRLARFNSITDTVSTQKGSFLGLPSPGAAGMIALYTINTVQNPDHIPAAVLPIIAILMAYLMISTYRYPSLAALLMWRQSHFWVLAVIVFFTGCTLLFAEIFLLLAMTSYVVYGPLRIVYLRAARSYCIYMKSRKSVGKHSA